LKTEFGLEPSPLYKQVLDRLEEERLSREDMTRQDALDLVRELLKTENRHRS